MHTQIIATIGSKSEDAKTLLKLFKAGVNIIRLNFSHASEGQYLAIKKVVDSYNKALGKKAIKIMVDLQGPRIRVGDLGDLGLNLKKGETYKLAYQKSAFRKEKGIIPIDYPGLHQSLKPGEIIYLINGQIKLSVLSIKKRIIEAKVLRGGLLESRKGINLPQTMIKTGGLTEKDKRDLAFGVKAGCDFIALSFVQSKEDMLKARKLLKQYPEIKLIAKIERQLALDNINEIIASSDLIMVARGDLGIEIPIENLPIVQKNLVQLAHWQKKPVIIATQVLSSMIKNPQATRAEVSDIANAIFDRADMIMLSDETAIGDYPLEAVKLLKRVIQRSEAHLSFQGETKGELEKKSLAKISK